MFSNHFIEKIKEEAPLNDTATSFDFKYGETPFVISKAPLEDDSQNIFQGHIGEGDALLFVYLKTTTV
jgi:hypothetical protein